MNERDQLAEWNIDWTFLKMRNTDTERFSIFSNIIYANETFALKKKTSLNMNEQEYSNLQFLPYTFLTWSFTSSQLIANAKPPIYYS